VSKRRLRHIFFFEITIWVVIIAAAIVATAISAAEPAGGEPAGEAKRAVAAPNASAEPTVAAGSKAGSEPNAGAEPAAPEPEGYWTGPINGAVPATLRGGTVLRTTDVEALLKKGKVLLIDASNLPKKPEKLAANAPWLPAPHAAIPETLWIPGSGMGEIAPEIDTLYREQLASATAGNLDSPVVVYCHERCWLSYNAARRAIAYGYRKVYWYPDGIEGWRAASLPTATVKAIER
jgi:PQQ-dependent catabolism-associated CXXCW motif protein